MDLTNISYNVYANLTQEYPLPDYCDSCFENLRYIRPRMLRESSEVLL